MPPLINKDEMDRVYSCNESEDDCMSMNMLDNVRDVGKSHPRVHRIEARYKIRDHIRQRQS